MSYHNGSVWPHDNAICAAGLMRYGFVREAQQVAVGILEAAEWFGGRLPELFCGFDRTEFAEPVYYPTSCSPQAWASAAPFHLLRTLLRFDPSAPNGMLWCDPALPPGSCRCTSSQCTWPAPGSPSTSARTAGRSTASVKSWNWSGRAEIR